MLTVIPVKSASFILLQGVPSDISLQEVDEAIREVEGVHGVHELHIWQLSESKVVASVHVHASRKHDFMKIAAEIRKLLHDRGIHSSTIQPEYYHPKHSQTSSTLVPVSLVFRFFFHWTRLLISDRNSDRLTKTDIA